MGASFQDRASRAAHGALAGLRRPATIACAYAAIAIATFGHAAGEQEAFLNTQCKTVEQRTKMPGLECYGDPAFDAAPAAILWPLYWSWELQS